MTTFIGRGSYVFATYSGDTVSTSKNIDYGEQLDGHWNYIFFGYKRKAQRAISYVLFSLTKEIKVQSFSNIDHDPINKFVRFYSGKEFSYKSFNGKISSLLVRIGPGAFIGSADELSTLVEGNSRKPETKVVQLFTEVVVDDETDSSIDGGASPFEKEEGIEEAFEYSASGWFKWKLKDATERQDCHLMFRLANTNPDVMKDQEHLGDRSLAAFQCSELVFATYHIGTIDKDFQANIQKNVALGEYEGFWNYIFMSYSRYQRVIN